MPDITDYLEQISTAVKGREVRSSIVSAIEECYNDGHAGSTDLTARQRINALTQDLSDTNDAVTDLNAEVNAIESAFTFQFVEKHTVSSAVTSVYMMGNMVFIDIHIQTTGSSTASTPQFYLSDDIPAPITDSKIVTSAGSVLVKKNDRGVYTVGSGGLFEGTLIYIGQYESADIVFKRRIVEELPEVGIENCVYFLIVDEESETNKYDEWVYINGAWEQLGGGGISKLPVIHTNVTAPITGSTTVTQG